MLVGADVQLSELVGGIVAVGAVTRELQAVMLESIIMSVAPIANLMGIYVLQT